MKSGVNLNGSQSLHLPRLESDKAVELGPIWKWGIPPTLTHAAEQRQRNTIRLLAVLLLLFDSHSSISGKRMVALISYNLL